jgi:hypothetical protein
MNKKISTTVGIITILLVAGVAGASVLFFNQGDEEEPTLIGEILKKELENEIVEEDGEGEFGKMMDEKIEDIPKTEEMGRYKKTASFSFDYTEEEKGFFKKGSHYNTYKGKENNMCIFSFEGRIFCFNNEGSIVADFNTGFSQSDCGTRGMVTDKENIYIICNWDLYRYDFSGVKKEKIDVSQNLKEVDILVRLYISKEKILYLAVDGKSSSFARIEDGNLIKVEPSADNGILGNITGNWYNLAITERWVSGRIKVTNDSKEIIFDKELKVDDIVGIRFLGEDKNDNFYIGFEVVKEGGVGTIFKIYRFNVSSGEYQFLEKDEECGAILSNDKLTLWNVVDEEKLWKWRIVKCEWK